MEPELAFILNDQQRRRQQHQPDPEPQPQKVKTEQTVVIERTDFTTANSFIVGDDTRAFPIFGPGRLEELLLITHDDTYTVNIELDTDSDMVGEGESKFISEDFPTLKEISTELSSVAAYENNEGNPVLNIGPIDFIEQIRVWVDPSAAIAVDRMRAELTVERFVESPS